MLALSSEMQISDAIKSLDISADALCALVGVAPTKLSQGLRGIRALTNRESILFLDTLAAIRDLVRQCAPIPVSLKNPKIIKELLEKIDDGSLQISVVRK